MAPPVKDGAALSILGKRIEGVPPGALEFSYSSLPAGPLSILGKRIEGAL